MGCNYYTRIKECKKCKRHQEIHLGKSSAGLRFTFQYNGGFFYKNIAEMQKWLKDKPIFDEYGNKISYTEFWNLVEIKQKKGLSYSEKYQHKNNFVVGEYSFINSEFS